MITSLRGREAEPRVAELLATAQVHRPIEERAARGPRIAEDYGRADHLALWGYEDARGLIGIAGVEPEHRDGVMLQDLAVLDAAQRSGVGRRLIAFLREQYPGRALFGDTVGSALGFYRALGFETYEVSALPSGARVYWFCLEARDALVASGGSQP